MGRPLPPEILSIAALLSVPNVFYRPRDNARAPMGRLVFLIFNQDAHRFHPINFFSGRIFLGRSKQSSLFSIILIYHLICHLPNQFYHSYPAPSKYPHQGYLGIKTRLFDRFLFSLFFCSISANGFISLQVPFSQT